MSNDVHDNNNMTITTTPTSDKNNITIVYKQSNIEISKDKENNYYINSKMIGNFIEFSVKEVIDDKYIIINTGLLTENHSLYDIYGNKISFLEAEKVGNIYMTYKNHILTVSANILDDNVENTICTFKSLDTIVFLKQEIKINNGILDIPKTIESKTLKEFAKDAYNKDC